MPFDQLFSGKTTTPAAGGTQTSAVATQPATTDTTPSNVPVNLENLGSGVFQGAVRDPISTAIPVGRWIERNIPGMRALDEWTGITPESIEAANQQYQQGAGQTLSGMFGRLGGNLLSTAALPVGGVANPVLRGALAGGIGSAATAGGYGENPLTAGAMGAVGGGAIGGITGALVRPVNTFLNQTADRLGIDLSEGDLRGGFLKRLEDLSAPLFGSGAGAKAEQNNRQIVNVLERNMGTPETGHLELPDVHAALDNAGADMGTAAGRMNVHGAAPSTSGIAGTPPLPLTNRLDEIFNNAATLGPAGTNQAAHAADVLRTQINSSIAAGGGVMPGADLQRFLAHGNTLDRYARGGNSDVQNVAAEVRNAVFAAANNTPGNPAGALDTFRAAQLRYKAALTAADAIGPTGSSQTMTPLGLKQAIQRHYMDQLTNPAATGAGYDIPDLARLIRGVPKLASSGTAERQMLYNLILGSGGIGGLSYLANPHVLSAAIAGIAPAAALSAAGRMSRFGPGMGVPGVSPVLSAAGAYVNPLLPRLFGQGAGNLLTTGNMPQPGGTQ